MLKKKIYYVPGLFSLLGLPVLLLIWGPDVVEPTPAPPSRWEVFCEWTSLRWQEFVFVIRYNKLLAAGFVVLILCPGVAALIRRRRATGIAPV